MQNNRIVEHYEVKTPLSIVIGDGLYLEEIATNNNEAHAVRIELMRDLCAFADNIPSDMVTMIGFNYDPEMDYGWNLVQIAIAPTKNIANL